MEAVTEALVTTAVPVGSSVRDVAATDVPCCRPRLWLLLTCDIVALQRVYVTGVVDDARAAIAVRVLLTVDVVFNAFVSVVTTAFVVMTSSADVTMAAAVTG